MRLLFVASLLAVAAAPCLGETTRQEFEVATTRGAKVRVVAHYPDGAHAGALPAVVIAPGQGYHMGLPLITGLAEEAARAGVIAYRFDWAYRAVEGGRPSEGLVDEVEDMSTVVSLALSEERVDPARVMLAGKSLGTLVAYRLFREFSKLTSLFLLTPVVSLGPSDPEAGPEAAPREVIGENYPDLVSTQRPVVMIAGEQDHLCALPVLYRALGRTKGNVKAVILGGDHSMNVGDWRDPAFASRNEANVKAAVNATVHWMRLLLEGAADRSE
jgi:alpha-beta hydrolase superfamily lysophospholipase